MPVTARLSKSFYDRFEPRMVRWMLTFWVGTMAGLAALVWAMVPGH